GLIQLWLSALTALPQDSVPPVLETYQQAPSLRPSPLLPSIATSSGASRQVNVNVRGENVIGDAANEPSFCIDPTNPNRLAVGWRQFNSVTNDFRQAGFAYSTNDGATWSAV